MLSCWEAESVKQPHDPLQNGARGGPGRRHSRGGGGRERKTLIRVKRVEKRLKIHWNLQQMSKYVTPCSVFTAWNSNDRPCSVFYEENIKWNLRVVSWLLHGLCKWLQVVHSYFHSAESHVSSKERWFKLLQCCRRYFVATYAQNKSSLTNKKTNISVKVFFFVLTVRRLSLHAEQLEVQGLVLRTLRADSTGFQAPVPYASPLPPTERRAPWNRRCVSTNRSVCFPAGLVLDWSLLLIEGKYADVMTLGQKFY